MPSNLFARFTVMIQPVIDALTQPHASIEAAQSAAVEATTKIHEILGCYAPSWVHNDTYETAWFDSATVKVADDGKHASIWLNLKAEKTGSSVLLGLGEITDIV